MRMLTRILYEATGSLPELVRANRKVSGRISCLEQCDPAVVYGSDPKSLLSEAILNGCLEQELNRRMVIEEKARTNVLGITLAFSVMFAGVAFLSSGPILREWCQDWAGWILLGPAFVGVSFLLVGGALALDVVRIAKIYMWSLEDETKYIDAKSRAAIFLWYIDLNQYTTLLKTNKTEASYVCIRNGVAVIAIAAIAYVLVRITL